MARKHTNVYDAMLAGFVKLLLVMGIGALTLSKFAGFEWLSIQTHHLEPIMQVKSPRQVLQFFEDSATNSSLWLAGLVFVYAAMGVFRIPGQMLMHILAGFSLGFAVAFPTALVANTVTSCALYHLGTLYSRGGATEAWQYYAQKIDVFVMKVAQANFNLYVDTNGAKFDKKKQAEIAATPNYALKNGIEKVKAEPDNWDEWTSWNHTRFMYMVWMRVFPFSEHWLLNMGGGLTYGMVTIFSEFFLATLLGNIPYIMFITKFGELMKHYWIQEMLQWPWVQWPLICLLALLPPIINSSGVLENAMGEGEYGWSKTKGKPVKKDDKDE